MKELVIRRNIQEKIQAKLNYMNGGAGGHNCHCGS